MKCICLGYIEDQYFNAVDYNELNGPLCRPQFISGYARIGRAEAVADYCWPSARVMDPWRSLENDSSGSVNFPALTHK